MAFDDLSQHTTHRRAMLACALMMAGVPTAAWAQATAAPMLRPGESIDVPGGRITVLGVDIKRGATTEVMLRMRALADAQQQLPIHTDIFRLLAADVPRAPRGMTTGDGTTSSFLVAKDSAVDFSCQFVVADKTDDLVLQLRVDGAVERRRLPGR